MILKKKKENNKIALNSGPHYTDRKLVIFIN